MKKYLKWDADAWDDYLYWQKTDKKMIKRVNDLSELLRLIEVGASYFNHYCTGCDFSQRSVLHNVHRRICSGYSIPTFCLYC